MDNSKEDSFADANYTDLLKQEIHCLLFNESSAPEGHCPLAWDGILCWSSSSPNITAYQPCMAELHGIKYDTTKSASRLCQANGTWANYSNYQDCIEREQASAEENVIVQTMIYLIGYGLSLVALIVAVWIFVYYKDLRCLRNTIHTNLMLTYICADSLWIFNHILLIHVPHSASCILLFILLYYLVLTNYFWMFVEGLYLYMLVVETFTRENIKLRAYLAIGWGTPLLVIIPWGIVRTLNGENVSSDHKECSWIASNSSDWIYKASAIIVLAVNVIFLIMIMWVLITKLRSSNNVETQQYRKATKALLVLIPLLGVTYILFLVGPSEGTYANIFAYIRAFLLSTQGLMVALFYCFLNSEVQNTIRHHFTSWKDSRNLGTRRYMYSKDCSPNTRTESIRLYSKHEVAPYKKRESTASENTTMTIVITVTTANNSTRLSNGSASVISGAGGGGGGSVSSGIGYISSANVRPAISPFLEQIPNENGI